MFNCLYHISLIYDLVVSIFSTLPTNGRFSTLYLISLGKITTAVSRDYACLIRTKPVVGCLGHCS